MNTMRRSRNFPKPTANWSPRPSGPPPMRMRPTRNSAWGPPHGCAAGRFSTAAISKAKSIPRASAPNYADDPIETLAIASNPSERECYPCGQCRQVMVDVERRQGSPMRVIMSGRGTATVLDSAARLLPFTFIL